MISRPISLQETDPPQSLNALGYAGRNSEQEANIMTENAGLAAASDCHALSRNWRIKHGVIKFYRRRLTAGS